MQNRIMFAGTSSDVGKTTIVLGIMRALKNRGMKVQGFKAGPDYIDTAFHTFATGIPSRNLDTWMLDEDVIKELLAKHASKADISIMEGVMGMFDGANIKSIEGSSAHLASITKTPVILIINGAGVALSAAAMVYGFVHFDESIDVKGVIVNKVSGDGHYQIIKEAIEHHVKIPCIGYLAKNEDISLKSRHLGLIPSVEVQALDEKVNKVAEMIEETMNLDLLLELSKEIVDFELIESKSKAPYLRVGVAYDQAFNFYYQDNLDYLKEQGCELVFFSPINDTHIPSNLDGLYIGGGFPEVFADQLENNITMKKSLKEAIESNMPTYAECGGLMYLTEYIETLEGNKHKMVGIYTGGSKMTKTLQQFGYVRGELNRDQIIGSKGTLFKGHEFHRSVVMNEDLERTYNLKKVNKDVTWQCGYNRKNCLGGYPHLHFYSNLEIANNFIKACEAYRRENE